MDRAELPKLRNLLRFGALVDKRKSSEVGTTMRELVYTSSHEVAKGHNVQRTVTAHHLRSTYTGELQIAKTTKFTCTCGVNEYDGTVSIESYQEHHQQLTEGQQ